MNSHATDEFRPWKQPFWRPARGNWWQTDIGWYIICTLEAVGLASRVKRPRA